MQMIIYCITNKINGKQYVGQTVRSLEERYSEHCRKLNTVVGKAIKKYGKENFNIEILDSSLIIDDLNDKETYWIKKKNTIIPNGYNLCYGGNSTLGYKHKTTSRLKMSATKKRLGNMVGEKNHFYGKKHTDETRAVMSAAWTDERKKKLAEDSKIRNAINQAVKVRNINTNEVFPSIKAAAEKYGIKATHISRVCRGGRKTTGGFKWEDVDKKTS